MLPVRTHFPVFGWYSSAVRVAEEVNPCEVTPPATRTRPEGSRVAVCFTRSTCIAPVLCHPPPKGSYRSLGPPSSPAARTRPLCKRVAVCHSRPEVIEPAPPQVPVDGWYFWALDKNCSSPPATRTSPVGSSVAVWSTTPSNGGLVRTQYPPAPVWGAFPAVAGAATPPRVATKQTRPTTHRIIRSQGGCLIELTVDGGTPTVKGSPWIAVIRCGLLLLAFGFRPDRSAADRLQDRHADPEHCRHGQEHLVHGAPGSANEAEDRADRQVEAQTQWGDHRA